MLATQYYLEFSGITRVQAHDARNFLVFFFSTIDLGLSGFAILIVSNAFQRSNLPVGRLPLRQHYRRPDL
jgi:hypothetical protein